ncbi:MULTISPECIES: hypothetical protein [unclassified Microcoleus]
MKLGKRSHLLAVEDRRQNITHSQFQSAYMDHLTVKLQGMS